MLEMFGTFALSVGAAVSSYFKTSSQILAGIFFTRILDIFQVGMEFWARWAHRALWHASLWNMHEVACLLNFLMKILILSIQFLILWVFVFVCSHITNQEKDRLS